ncbi:antibiotic biosynthesis monooxygenase [Oceanobacillus sp. FSL W8-0428]|uniref:antibiotic biosynthesis monooxygenase n=1 Tax=Oceanobacillus sp. FSL W8-0428 TaxID=2921715 RepID=UPI0030FA9281
MIKVVNTLRVKKGKVNEVAALFQKAKAVHIFDGFVFMEVLIKENTAEYDELQVCTTWDDHASFEVWRESRETRKAHESQNKEEKEDSPILGTELSIFEVFVQHHPA